jgi:hypothetical protein
MGGFGSGRHGGKPTVEGGLVLDLNKLIRDRLFRPGSWSGSLVWTEVYTGRRTADLRYEVHMAAERGHVRLRYTTTDPWSGEKRHHDYPIELATTPQPFGGRRWWWVCPRLGDRVSKLYLPAGASIFASRKCFRIAYHSQREAPYDRAIGRAFKLRRRLGSTGGIGDEIDKPKGMRWATFDRKMEKIEQAEAAVDAHLWRLLGRLG